ncbi:TPA: LemA family protein [bacterium]|nr:LemA family protein [bacterium]
MNEKINDQKQKLANEKISDQEAEEILQRASKLQQEAENTAGSISRSDLTAGANEVGIKQEYIDKAIDELRIEQRQKAESQKRRKFKYTAIGGVLIVILVIITASGHGSLNARMSDVEAKKAQLENVLQRRHDLIPNLISLAKASARHEKELVDSLSNLYQEVGKAKSFEDKQALESKLDNSIQEVLSAMLADPQSSSTDVFLRLSDEMSGAENRISVERKRYNESVASYNKTARSFPVSLIRPLLGFPSKIALFEASKESKETPKF